jgi:hypothetical protein
MKILLKEIICAKNTDLCLVLNTVDNVYKKRTDDSAHIVAVKIIHPPLLHHSVSFSIQQIEIVEGSDFHHRIVYDTYSICKYF